jgi:hypothetical protein
MARSHGEEGASHESVGDGSAVDAAAAEASA